jgi:SagB-type dehydrogenase family enzyme
MVKLEVPGNIPTASLVELLRNRKSHREFLEEPLTLDEVSALLWAALGYREGTGSGRTVPSAGAIYPVEIQAVIGRNCVKGLDEGVYGYVPQIHSIDLMKQGDLRQDIAAAALSQDFLGKAPLLIVITADVGKTTLHYGKRGMRYVHMDVGHVGQNVYLMVFALGLGTCAVGAFRDEKVAAVLSLPKDIFPFYIMPVGRVAV